MVQTRNQKKIIDNFNNLKEMEKNAVRTLIEISEMETRKNNILDNYSEIQIQNFKMEITRKFCKDTLSKYDVVIPDLVKYCPYNGCYESQINQALKEKNMETYFALLDYKIKMEQYTNVSNYLKNNFDFYLNNVTPNDIVNYIKEKDIIFLETKKIELRELKEIKNIKELIEMKKSFKSKIDLEIVDLENKYNCMINEFKKKYC